MTLNDASSLIIGFGLIESDGGGLDEGWEENEQEDEDWSGFEIEDEDGVLEEDGEEWDADPFAEEDPFLLWDDDGPESWSEADPE